LEATVGAFLTAAEAVAFFAAGTAALGAAVVTVEDLLTGGFRSLAMAMSVVNCTAYAIENSPKGRVFPRSL
jgi:hypothetical protein